MDIFDEILSDTPEDVDVFVDLSMQIADKVHDLLSDSGLTMREFAKEMDISEEDVYIWLRGIYNFTLDDIAKLTVLFGQNIIEIPEPSDIQIAKDKQASEDYTEAIHHFEMNIVSEPVGEGEKAIDDETILVTLEEYGKAS